jgi:TPR repeat protein
LGNMFLNGYGVRKSKAEAVQFYRLAAAQGDADASAILQRLRAA